MASTHIAEITNSSTFTSSPFIPALNFFTFANDGTAGSITITIDGTGTRTIKAGEVYNSLPGEKCSRFSVDANASASSWRFWGGN